MESSDEFSTDDLSSFEMVELWAPELLGPATDEDRHVPHKDKTKLKTKLISAWNTVRYRGWSLKSRRRLSRSRPVCLLGQSYQLSFPGEREAFRRAFSSLLWMTYRRGFTPLDGSRLTSDAGWGCTLRSAQMLLARALLLHMMPPGWTWPATHRRTQDDLEVVDSRVLKSLRGVGQPRRLSLDVVRDGGAQEDGTHRRIVSCFADQPSAPFGLHRLVEWGRTFGRRAGDWYGPATAAHILEKAVSASELLNLAVYVAQDCTVYTGDVLALCGTSRMDRSLLLLVPVRLGSDVLNPVYSRCVKSLLELRCCVGIIGGKPKHSLFFVGHQVDQLIYLDPHYCQPAVDVQQQDFPLQSFHCKTVRKMAFERMDPCCTLGFYARGRADFQTLCSDVTQVLRSSQEKYPIFTFVEGHKAKERICLSGQFEDEPDLELDEFVLL